MISNDLISLKENFNIILSSIKETGEIKIFFSLSEIDDIYSEIEEKIDLVRTSFTLMCISLYCSKYKVDKANLDKINRVFDFISTNRLAEKKDSNILFIDLYVLQSAIYLNRESNFVNSKMLLFKESFFSVKNKYNNPLLANKLISFYEEFKDIFDLNEIERDINNLKSVMVYLISSNLSKRFPFFYFADMLTWSRGTVVNKKVELYIESEIKHNDLNFFSTSGLAYVLECKLSSGAGVDKKLYGLIDSNKITKNKNYLTLRLIPYGLYLNTRYDNSICLDTNTHLLLGSLKSTKYER